MSQSRVSESECKQLWLLCTDDGGSGAGSNSSSNSISTVGGFLKILFGHMLVVVRTMFAVFLRDLGF